MSLEDIFEENCLGVDDKKALLHAKRWGLYVKEKGKIVKGGYPMEVVGHDKKKVLWEVVKDHVAEEPSDHEDIGLRGLISMFSTKMRRGVLGKVPVSFHIY